MEWEGRERTMTGSTGGVEAGTPWNAARFSHAGVDGRELGMSAHFMVATTFRGHECPLNSLLCHILAVSW